MCPPRILLLAAFSFFAACDSTTAVQPGSLSVRYVTDGAPAQVSFADQSGTSQAISTGRWEHRFEAQAGDAVFLTAVSTNSSPVTGSIYLNGALSRMERGSQVHLELSTSTHQSGEIEVRGFIEARTANQVTVLGRTFVIDSQTRLLGRNNETVSFDAFRLGDFIEAEGHAEGDGTIRAKKLKLEDGDDQDQVEIRGSIEARTESSVTVNGVHFAVDERTEFLDDNNNPISFSAFRVGNRVEVEGFVRPDGTHYAEKLKLDDN